MRYFLYIVPSLLLIGCSEQQPPPKSSQPTQIRVTAPKVKVQSGELLIKPIENPDLNSEYVVLSDIPKLTLSENLDPEKSIDQVEKLIASLAAIENPDSGLSPTMSGTAFLPIEGKTNVGALLLTDHQLKSSDALRQLVAIGPAALPALLAHPDDATPTKFKIVLGGVFGGMWFAMELWGNPVSQTEQSVLQSLRRPKNDPIRSEHVSSYPVKVGDICFVAIGQITGRTYRTVRYQPSSCIVLNSPTYDPVLCGAVRALWQSENPRQKLFDSLLLDYATRGKFNGESLDGWHQGSSAQSEAAMRLLYYFPTDSAALIADRIDYLDVTRTGPPSAQPASESELDAFIKREVANGVRTDDFIESTFWSQHPDIIAAIKSVAERTDDEDIMELVGKDG